MFKYKFMMRTIFILFIALISSAISMAQGEQNISTFANLQTLNITDGIIVHYPKSGVVVVNKSCVDLSKNDPFYTKAEEDYEGVILVLQMKIGENNPKAISVLFSNGPSDDPNFIFINSDGEQIESIGGTELFLPGNSYVYTTGHANTSFNKRSKYYYDGKSFVEVKQPFYYVGLKTVTTKAITLYTDKSQKEIVGNVPINTEVEVLLAEYIQNFGGMEYFLVKTPFGLVGWIGFATYNLSEGTPLKGIYFAGD